MNARTYVKTLVVSLVFLLLFPMYGMADSNVSVKSQQVTNDWIRKKIKSMTTEEKVGQLFIVHVYGQTPTDPDYEDQNLENNRGGKHFKEIIEKYHIGGVIYFNWTDNITMPLDADQVHSLSNGLQNIAMDQNASIPLFISTDQEGGIVQRVTSPGTVFPGNMAVGATQSEEYAAATASIIGKELNSLGINMDFAPVVDVNINPKNPVIGVRSFSESPDMVSHLGLAQIEAFKKENVIASAKHFPGHGDTATDSHYGLPIIDHDLETLHEIDLKPFQAAIDAGIDAIMPGHIVVPALDDSGRPATLSQPILTDLLREEMGFNGLIITDSLGMEGANVVEPEEIPVEAFNAGADILLNPPDVELAYNSMLEAVEDGEVSQERLDASVFRILKAKADRGLFDDPYTDPDAIDKIGSDEHLQTAKEIADRSITLVKNDNGVLPLEKNEKVFITGPSDAKPELLADQLHDKGMDTNYLETNTKPTDKQIEAAVQKAKKADSVIVVTFTVNENKEQQQLVEAIRETDIPVIVGAVQNPYDLTSFPEVDAYLNAYGDRDISIKALSRAIVGDINPFGKLPVTIPDMYDYGHGLDYVDTPLSAEGMKILVDNLNNDGDIDNGQTLEALRLHLTAISHYEKQDKPDKIIKHMEGFKKLVDRQKNDQSISNKVYSFLMTQADRFIEKWTDETID